METKYLLFSVAAVTLIPVGSVAAAYSRRIQDALFLAMVFFEVMSTRLNIHFFSREWYRGTSQGIEVSFVDFFLISLFFGVMVQNIRDRRPMYWPASLGIMLLYFGYGSLSVLFSEPQLFGIFELAQLIRGMLVFLTVAYYVRGKREEQLLILALCSVVICATAVAISQRYIFQSYLRTPGTLEHPQGLSMYCCTVAPLFLAYAFSMAKGLLKLVCLGCYFLCVICVALAISRSGIATIVFVGMMAMVISIGFKLTPKRIAVFVVMLICIGGVLVRSQDQLANRFKQATVEQYTSSEFGGRGYFWQMAWEMIKDNPFGVGLNNWSYWASAEYGPRIGRNYRPYEGTDEPPDRTLTRDMNTGGQAQAAMAHSLICITMGELGWPGLFILALLWCRWFFVSGFLWLQRRDIQASFWGRGIFFALLSLFLCSIVEWGFRTTQMYFLVNTLLGTIAAQYSQVKARREILY